MTFAYGGKFSDQWRGVDVAGLKRHWATELGKYTPEQLKAGVARLKTRDWPPTLPEFEKLCQPTIDPMVAYYEAVHGVQARASGEMGNWSHPAIFWAAMPMSFDLGNQTFSQIKGRWENALTEQMARGEWAEIPKPMIALPAPGKSDLAREKASAMLAQLGAAGVLKIRHEDTAWYRKILQRVKNGDKTVTQYLRSEAEKGALAHGYKA